VIHSGTPLKVFTPVPQDDNSHNVYLLLGSSRLPEKFVRRYVLCLTVLGNIRCVVLYAVVDKAFFGTLVQDTVEVLIWISLGPKGEGLPRAQYLRARVSLISVEENHGWK